MKQLIVLFASILLLLPFVFQFSLEQKNYYKKSQFQLLVNNAKEAAKQEGYFTEDIIKHLLNEMEDKLNINSTDVLIEVTRSPRYREDRFSEAGLIFFRIGIPIKKIIANNLFFGISDAENTSYYIIENTTTSELIRR